MRTSSRFCGRLIVCSSGPEAQDSNFGHVFPPKISRSGGVAREKKSAFRKNEVNFLTRSSVVSHFDWTWPPARALPHTLLVVGGASFFLTSEVCGLRQTQLDAPLPRTNRGELISRRTKKHARDAPVLLRARRPDREKWHTLKFFALIIRYFLWSLKNKSHK